MSNVIFKVKKIHYYKEINSTQFFSKFCRKKCCKLWSSFTSHSSLGSPSPFFLFLLSPSSSLTIPSTNQKPHRIRMCKIRVRSANQKETTIMRSFITITINTNSKTKIKIVTDKHRDHIINGGRSSSSDNTNNMNVAKQCVIHAHWASKASEFMFPADRFYFLRSPLLLRLPACLPPQVWGSFPALFH